MCLSLCIVMPHNSGQSMIIKLFNIKFSYIIMKTVLCLRMLSWLLWSILSGFFGIYVITRDYMILQSLDQALRLVKSDSKLSAKGNYINRTLQTFQSVYKKSYLAITHTVYTITKIYVLRSHMLTFVKKKKEHVYNLQYIIFISCSTCHKNTSTPHTITLITVTA